MKTYRITKNRLSTCDHEYVCSRHKQRDFTSRQMQHSSCPESGLHLCFPSRRLSRHTLQTSQWKDLSLWILSKHSKLAIGSRICYFVLNGLNWSKWHKLMQISVECSRCCFPTPPIKCHFVAKYQYASKYYTTGWGDTPIVSSRR